MPSSHARGATRRVPKRRKRRLPVKWATFDRWLDRLVTIAVVTAILVGVVALTLSWFLEG